MNKKALLIPILLGMFLASCGGGGEAPSSQPSSVEPSSEPTPSSESSSEDPSKENFTNVFFDSASYTYDGESHILNEVRGAPEGTTITYTGREAKTNIGTYNASAKLVKEGYNDKTLSATLTITPATFSGLTYANKSVKYDGAEHINDIQLVGVLPAGTTKTETVKN